MRYPRPGMKVKLNEINLKATVEKVFPMSLYFVGYKQPFSHGEWSFIDPDDFRACEYRKRIECKSCEKLSITNNSLELVYHLCSECFNEMSRKRKE